MTPIREVQEHPLTEMRDRLNRLSVIGQVTNEVISLLALVDSAEAEQKEDLKISRKKCLQEGYSRASNRISALRTRVEVLEKKIGMLLQDVSSAKAAEKEAKRRDQRTGLLLDPAFREEVQLFIRSVVRDRRETAQERVSEYGAIVFFDLDNLKSVNMDPALGYPYGTRMINTMTRILRKGLRTGVSKSARLRNDDPSKLGGTNGDPARMGGDEFAVLLTGLKVASYAVDVAQRLKKKYDGAKWNSPDLRKYRPSVSGGVAILPLSILTGSVNKVKITDQWIDLTSKVMMEQKHRSNIGITMLDLDQASGNLFRVPYGHNKRSTVGMRTAK